MAEEEQWNPLDLRQSEHPLKFPLLLKKGEPLLVDVTLPGWRTITLRHVCSRVTTSKKYSHILIKREMNLCHYKVSEYYIYN